MSHSRDGLRTACITVLGSGLIPIVPGTWGSFTAILLFLPLLLLYMVARVRQGVIDLAIVAGVLVACWLSVRWGAWAIARWQRGDPRQFVLDEFAGQWIALLVLPLAADANAWSALCVLGSQFVLFRIFDVWKPPPACQLEALPTGWGILCDDLFAGGYANLAGQLIWRLTPLATWLGVQVA